MLEPIFNGITIRGVYGNIDNHEIRGKFPKEIFFEIEGISVYITHIGGYPQSPLPGTIIKESQTVYLRLN